jgi:hypothetical protein
VKPASAGVDLAGTVEHLGVVDHSGLVEIGDSSAFGFRGRDSPVQACQLGSQQLVVGGRGVAGGQGGFSGGEQLGAGEQLTYLIEHVGIEFVGSHAPLRASAIGSAGAPGVAVRAKLVAGCSLTTAGAMADEFDSAVGAAQQPAQ